MIEYSVLIVTSGQELCMVDIKDWTFKDSITGKVSLVSGGILTPLQGFKKDSAY